MSLGHRARHVAVHRVEEVLGVLAVAVGESVWVVLVQRGARRERHPSRVAGRLISAVSPVLVLMLAKITVSVRVPTRPGPASPPSSKTFSRGLPAHGSCGFGSPGAVCVASRVGLVALFVSFSLLNTAPTELAVT